MFAITPHLHKLTTEEPNTLLLPTWVQAHVRITLLVSGGGRIPTWATVKSTLFQSMRKETRVT